MSQFIKLHRTDGVLYIRPEDILSIRTWEDEFHQITEIRVEVKDGKYDFDGDEAKSNYSILLPYTQ